MFKRYATAALTGTIVTLALLYAMHALIRFPVAHVAPSERLPQWLGNVTIAAAERSRFRARVANGVPLPTQGLRKRFVFEMERG